MAKRVSNVSVVPKRDASGRICEDLNILLRRFKKKLDKENTLQEMRKREFYVKPTEKRKLKSKLASKRRQRDEAKKTKAAEKYGK